MEDINHEMDIVIKDTLVIEIYIIVIEK